MTTLDSTAEPGDRPRGRRPADPGARLPARRRRRLGRDRRRPQPRPPRRRHRRGPERRRPGGRVRRLGDPSSSSATCSWPRSTVRWSAMRWATASSATASLVAETQGRVAPEDRRRRHRQRAVPRDAGPAGRRVRRRPAARARASCASYRARQSRRPTAALLAEHGYVPIRYGFEMRRYLTGALPEHPLPAGPGDAARHRGPVPRDLRRRQRGVRGPLGPPRARRGRLPGALPRPRDGPATVVRGLGRRPGRGRRDERDLPRRERGARDPARLAGARLGPPSVARRGVAKALCAASFRLLREQGMDEAWLGVDGTNPTGALQLYEGLGSRRCAAGWRTGGRWTGRRRRAGVRTATDPPEGGHRPAFRTGGGPGRGPAPSRPARARSSWRRRGPGSTAQASSSSLSRAIDADHRLGVAAREVDAAPAAREQRVAAEQQAVVAREQADRALGVARGVQDAQPDLAEPDLAALGQLHRRHRRDDLERGVQRLRRLEPVGVGGWTAISAPVCSADGGVVTHVVPVAVRVDDQLQGPVALRQGARDPVEARASRCRSRSPRGCAGRRGRRRWSRAAR